MHVEPVRMNTDEMWWQLRLWAFIADRALLGVDHDQFVVLFEYQGAAAPGDQPRYPDNIIVGAINRTGIGLLAAGHIDGFNDKALGCGGQTDNRQAVG